MWNTFLGFAEWHNFFQRLWPKTWLCSTPTHRQSRISSRLKERTWLLPLVIPSWLKMDSRTRQVPSLFQVHNHQTQSVICLLGLIGSSFREKTLLLCFLNSASYLHRRWSFAKWTSSNQLREQVTAVGSYYTEDSVCLWLLFWKPQRKEICILTSHICIWWNHNFWHFSWEVVRKLAMFESRRSRILSTINCRIH